MENRTLYFGDNLDILREKFPNKPDGDGYFDLSSLLFYPKIPRKED